MLRLHVGSPSRHSFQLSMDFFFDLVLGPGTCTFDSYTCRICSQCGGGTILSTRDISPG